MKFEFYRVKTGSDEAGSAALNKALGLGGIISLTKEFVQNGDASFWAFCLERAPVQATRQGRETRTEKVDYKKRLKPEQFSKFLKLRELRTALSKSEGIPAYGICTNEQLAAMLEGSVNTISGLLQIEGFGQVRGDKYGEALLAVLNAEPEESK